VIDLIDEFFSVMAGRARSRMRQSIWLVIVLLAIVVAGIVAALVAA